MIASLILLAAAAATPPDFDAFFEDFAKRRADIYVLQAEYTEKSITPDETFISEGALLYAQPRRIVRRTFYPYEAYVVIDGSQAVEYEPEVKQAVVSDLSAVREADILFFGFDSDTRRLRENYDVKLFIIEDNPLGKHGLEIKPKAGDEAPPFQSVTLYLSDELYLPYRIHVVFDAESELQVDIGEYTINAAVSPEDTQVTLAEGTKLIENDQVLETVGPGGKRVPDRSIAAAQPAAEPAKEEAVSVPGEESLIEVAPLEDPAAAEAAPAP